MRPRSKLQTGIGLGSPRCLQRCGNSRNANASAAVRLKECMLLKHAHAHGEALQLHKQIKQVLYATTSKGIEDVLVSLLQDFVCKCLPVLTSSFQHPPFWAWAGLLVHSDLNKTGSYKHGPSHPSIPSMNLDLLKKA